MLKKMNRNAAFLAAMSALLCLLLLTVATYAWFTSNQSVSTTRAEARTSDSNVKLLLGTKGGAEFEGLDTVPITQVNQANKENLLPVSTSDLHTWLFNSMTINDYASSFATLQNEEHIYHGVVYVRALLSGDNITRKMAVYLEKSTATGGDLVQGGSGLLPRASRLGLSIDGQAPVILSLTAQQSEAAKQAHNTMLNGEVVPDGKVLTKVGDTVTAVADPSVLISSYIVDTEQEGAQLPEKPLFVLENGQIYPLHVYFYLEGCDPDCSDSVSLDNLDLHLSFYGVVQ